MADRLSFKDMRGVSKWWQRGIDKERQRLTNTPKPPKGDRFSTPPEFSNFAPPLKRMPKQKAWPK